MWVGWVQGLEAAESPHPDGTGSRALAAAELHRVSFSERTEPTQPQPHSKILEPPPSLPTRAPVNPYVSSSPKRPCPQLPPPPPTALGICSLETALSGCRLTSPCSEKETAWEIVTGQEERTASLGYSHRDGSV